MKENVLVFGASMNRARASNTAVELLSNAGHHVRAFGLREGEINGVPIETVLPEIENLDTLTLYVGPQNQPPYYDYFLKLKPRRVIFNPGTENREFMDLLTENGIAYEAACTLVLVSTGQY
ncbi:CoA-binding protein [Paracrocinitomix mangrovi]|uniref:CoA-binding protein n=1 Tax=Paracrocinitomix mangrovi TaxID=2862509 RepID=UPI001C8D062A|nr:CoA-binding protein [Paracrocinitomix mangrovi]UKN02028.1 CoA-binding protein [Paracrocinitomix mangrovi]